MSSWFELLRHEGHVGGTFLPELVLLKIYTSSWYFQLFFKRGKKLELYWKSRSTSEYVFKKKKFAKIFFSAEANFDTTTVTSCYGIV
jgi:hypothetical protein